MFFSLCRGEGKGKVKTFFFSLFFSLSPPPPHLLSFIVYF